MPPDLLNISTFLIGLLLWGYLWGSIPFGLLLTRLAGLGDIRSIGSGNIGATNVLRTGNKGLAAATLGLDALKGGLAILVFPLLLSPADHLMIVPGTLQGLLIGLGAVLGHMFPLWLKFRGGKGVATALGIFLAAIPFTGIGACATWLIVARISRYSSAAALTALALAPVMTFFFHGSVPSVFCALISLLVWMRHTGNIRRLIAGQEPKIGGKA